MQVSKLTPEDFQTLLRHRRIKHHLGVIHPLPCKRAVTDVDDSAISRLTVKAEAVKIEERQGNKPGPRLAVPMRRRSPGKQTVQPAWGSRSFNKQLGKVSLDVPEKALSSKQRGATGFLLGGKDLETSTGEYKQKLAHLLNKPSHTTRTEFTEDQAQALKLLSQKASGSQLSDEEYKEAKEGIEKIGVLYDQQVLKEKVISGLLCEHTQGGLDIKALHGLLGQRQLRQHHTFTAMQRFCRCLEESLVEKTGTSYAVGLQTEALSRAILSYEPKLSETERAHLTYFLQQIQLSVTAPLQARSPVKAVEECLDKLYEAWDQEQTLIADFIEDATQAVCYEQNLDRQAISSRNRSRSSVQLELRVVAEFISQYLDRLRGSLNKRYKALKAILYALVQRKGKLTWQELRDTANLKVKSRVVGSPQKSREPIQQSAQLDLSIKAADSPRTPKKRPQSAAALQSQSLNAGSLAVSPMGLNSSMIGCIDDAPLPIDSTKTLSPGQSRPLKGSSASPQSAVKLPFTSIDRPLKEPNSEAMLAYKARLAELEPNLPVNQPEVKYFRTELLRSGAIRYSPYLDPHGKLFDPAEKYKDLEPFNKLSPHYLAEMVKKKPSQDEEWCIRPHHLQSVTRHPLSINDHPELVNKADLPSPGRPLTLEPDLYKRSLNFLEGELSALREDLQSLLERKSRTT